MVSTTCQNGHVNPSRNKYGKCRPCATSWAQKWRAKNPLKDLHSIQMTSWKIHGIMNFTPLDYDRLYQIQQGRCAICKRHSSELKRRLAVDHSHKTGQVRGLLYGHCNLRLDALEDKNFIAEAQAYLNKGRTISE